MKNAKLLKSILIPTLGISAIGTIAAISTSCGVRVTGVWLDKSSIDLAAGDTETLTATVLPGNATDKSVTWTSSDSSVATVDSNGTITAVTAGTATITVTTNIGGNTATCEVTVINPYVTITANANSAVTFVHDYMGTFPNLEYSIDCTTSWATFNRIVSINQGQTLYLRGYNPTGWSHSTSVFSYFTITGDVSISGSVMGLLDNGAKPWEQGNITDIPCQFCFYDLFRFSSGITSVSDNFLSAANLTDSCYRYMFNECSSLVKAPELPATDLTEGRACYQGMFHGCTSLKSAPYLPATSLLSTDCYARMFDGCAILNSIKLGYTGNYNSAYFSSWVNDVASSGAFYYNGSDTCANFGLRGWSKQPLN